MTESKTTDRQQLQNRLSSALPQTEQAVPAFNDFLGQLIVAFGGPNALAQEYFRTYADAKEGSASRVQLMLKISELLLRNSQHFGTPAKVEELSDAELGAVLNKFLESNDELARKSDKSGGPGPDPQAAEPAPEDQDRRDSGGDVEEAV